MQWQEKSHVTDVTRFEKWHQWHVKNKHIARGEVDTQWVIILVQSVQWVFTLKYFPRLTLQQEILIVEEAMEIVEETFLKVEEELGDTRRRIFILWWRIVSSAILSFRGAKRRRIWVHSLKTNFSYLIVIQNEVKNLGSTMRMCSDPSLRSGWQASIYKKEEPALTGKLFLLLDFN